MFSVTNKAELTAALERLDGLDQDIKLKMTPERYVDWKQTLEDVSKCDGWLRGQERYLRDKYTYDHNSASLVFSMNRVSPGGVDEYVQQAKRDDRAVRWPLAVGVTTDGALYELADEAWDTNESPDDAIFDLMAFVVHKGFLTIHGGHYGNCPNVQPRMPPDPRACVQLHMRVRCTPPQQQKGLQQRLNTLIRRRWNLRLVKAPTERRQKLQERVVVVLLGLSPMG